MNTGPKNDWAEAIHYARKAVRRATFFQAVAPALLFAVGVATYMWMFPTWTFGRLGFFVAAMAFIIFVRPYLDKPKRHRRTPLKSVEAASPAAPNEGGARRNVLVESVVSSPAKGIATIPDVFKAAAQAYPKRPCMGTRVVNEVFTDTSGSRPCLKKDLGDFTWQTFDDVSARIDAIGNGLVNLGLRPGSNVALYADTTADWMTCAQACFARHFPVVTVYAALGLDALAHGIAETEVSVVFLNESLLPKIAEVMNGRKVNDEGREIEVSCNVLKTVVLIGEPASDDVSKDVSALRSRSDANGGPIEVIRLSELEAAGDAYEGDVSAYIPSAKDLAVIMYTSGSTGIPKGVLISHANIVAAVAGLKSGVAGLCEEDVYLAYLPLAHVLELCAEITIISVGAALGYGSPHTLTDTSRMIPANRGTRGDAPTLRPTLMAAVPAVMDMIRDGILSKLSSAGFVKSSMFKVAFAMKKAAFLAGHESPFWDWLVFDRLRTKLLGGHVRLMLSGGGPLSSTTQLFMNIAFCCPVGQGYGLTETCGCGTIVWPDDMHYGRVGPPLTSLQLKLVDWEEGGYLSSNDPPSGEICMSGGPVTMGYFKREEKTAAEFRTHADGKRWFHTGDVGMWCEDGTLKIIDRKKDLVKLSRGEYVSLGKVESTLKDVGEVDNLCVYANSHQPYCVAVVVPSASLLDSGKSDKELADEIQKALQKRGKAGNLESFEIPRKVLITREPWTPENEMVTQALKLKRNNIYKTFKSDLENLYK